MSWEDEDFGIEYYKIDKEYPDISMLYDDRAYVGLIQPFYDTLDDYQNQWNKKRKKMRVYNIIRADYTPYDNDIIETNDNLWLDMGARLFNAIKPFAKKKTKYLKITKLVGNKSKFDITYFVDEYKIVVQKQISAGKTKK